MCKGPTLLLEDVLLVLALSNSVIRILQVSIFSSVKPKKITQNSRYVEKTGSNLCKTFGIVSQQTLVVTYMSKFPFLPA